MPKIFTPPELIDVISYVTDIRPERGPAYAVDQGNAFYDHFSSNGWKVGGKTKMVDWKAAVRTWIRNDERWYPPQKENQQKNVIL